jgi:hypothetical protein
MSNAAHRQFRAIIKGWNTGVSSSDLYHMIISWMDGFKNEIDAKREVKRFMRRAEKGDSTNDLVEDFIYGAGCVNIRKQFELKSESVAESDADSDSESID